MAGRREQFYGAVNRGTNFTGELMAYVHPLMWLMGSDAKLAGKRLHIVTDNKPITEGVGAHGKQQMLFAMLATAKSRGLILKWHWIPRSVVADNRFADRQANAARLALKYLESPASEA